MREKGERKRIERRYREETGGEIKKERQKKRIETRERRDCRKRKKILEREKQKE